MEKIRIHHLLCLPLFAGEGYSDHFCVNMGSVKRSLEENPGRRLETVCGPDLVCAHCPNRIRNPEFCGEPGQWKEFEPGENGEVPEFLCREDNNHVVEKDRELADWLDIRVGEVYTWHRLLNLAAERLTEAQFEASCSRCRWYRQGLCSYIAWRAAVRTPEIPPAGKQKNPGANGG